ncbi:MAG: alkylhydroperoxidase [Ilumatobacteraceae bacterium]
MWIKHVPYEQADGRLRLLYDRLKGPNDNVDNIMLAHSLRPNTMEGHMALYKYALHHSANTVPKWFLETIGVHVNMLNSCAYCVEHHFNGLKRLIDDDFRADAIRAALGSATTSDLFDAAQTAALHYAESLTLTPADHERIERHVLAMRAAGLDDGQILEINQVASYFNYANRTVIGLGVTLDGDVLGLSPSNSDDPDDWSHR